MTESKKVLIISIISGLLICIIFIFCFIESIINEDNYHLLFSVLLTFSIIFSYFRIKDYKYITGKLSYKEFKNHNKYEYWFLLYGNKAYKKYLEKYK